MECNNIKQKREDLIDSLTKFLSILRAAIGISQGELAEYVGISRQTYCAIEQGKRQMSWSTFCALYLFFSSNSKTFNLLKVHHDLDDHVHEIMQYDPCNQD